MSVTGIFLLGLCSLFFVEETQGAMCYDCKEFPFARECPQVRACGPHEVCYVDLYVKPNGQPYRNMGCRDSMQCVAPGKRSSSTDNIQVCSECCHTPWCQANLCGQGGLPPDRGPICFNCDIIEPGALCGNIIECGRDEVCYESLRFSTTGHPVFKSGCFGKDACKSSQIALATIPHHCFECCENDTCNLDCGVYLIPTQKTTTSTTTTSTTTTTTTPRPAPVGPTIAGCADIRTPTFCKLAQQLVCTDVNKATNAGCLATCGFCNAAG